MLSKIIQLPHLKLLLKKHLLKKLKKSQLPTRNLLVRILLRKRESIMQGCQLVPIWMPRLSPSYFKHSRLLPGKDPVILYNSWLISLSETKRSMHQRKMPQPVECTYPSCVRTPFYTTMAHI